MSQISIRLPHWPAARFDIDADKEILELLISDLANSDSDLGPGSAWTIDDRTYQSMEQMLAPWCGKGGMQLIAEPDQVRTVTGKPTFLADRLAYVHGIDYLGILNGVTLKDLGAMNWRIFDLTSLADFLIVNAFRPVPAERFTLLEVGGGFGRIPEFFTAAGCIMKYVNVDAVPASLMYCYRFLSARFPDKITRIFSIHTDRLDDDTDFLIVPAWLSKKINRLESNYSMNIESFQEMDQRRVDYYYDFIDMNTEIGGCIYMVNSRVYKFRGEWNVPPHWDCMLKHTTHRAWTADHPTEVFIKSAHDCSARQLIRDQIHRAETELRSQRLLVGQNH